jgi:hypothetical protein
VVGCESPTPDASLVAKIERPIAYGNADTQDAHTAVVAVLSPVNSQSFQECTGSIVQVQNTSGYVLTAAHCCNAYVPTVVVVNRDYSIGENAVFGGSFSPPAPVVAGSVYYDPLYPTSGGQDHDFCMLQFSGATSETATLALPLASGDGLALGSAIEHIGFGQTDESTTNSVRRTGTDLVDALSDFALQFSQGGPDQVSGTCDGDSGGPSLFPAGAPQASQSVVGVQSYGDASTCATATFGVASRVTSEIGPGMFITSYLADAPTGVHVAASTPVPACPHWALIATALALLGRLGRDPSARGRPENESLTA